MIMWLAKRERNVVNWQVPAFHCLAIYVPWFNNGKWSVYCVPTTKRNEKKDSKKETTSFHLNAKRCDSSLLVHCSIVFHMFIAETRQKRQRKRTIFCQPAKCNIRRWFLIKLSHFNGMDRTKCDIINLMTIVFRLLSFDEFLIRLKFEVIFVQSISSCD